MPSRYQDIDWGYVPELPSVDKRGGPARVPYGLLTKGVGLDPRRVGRLTNYPGFRRLQGTGKGITGGRLFPDPTASNGPTDGTAYETVIDFKYFSIEEDYKDPVTATRTPYKVTGFWVRGTTDGTDSADLCSLHYYDGRTGLWDQFILEEGTTGSGILDGEADIASFGKYMYYARDGINPKVFYWDTIDGLFVLKEMGPGEPIPREEPCELQQLPTGGVLEGGKIEVAYRYANKDRYQFSALSDPIEVEMPHSSSPIEVSGTISTTSDFTAGNVGTGSGTAGASIFLDSSAVFKGDGGVFHGIGTMDLPFHMGEQYDEDIERLNGYRVLVSGPVDSEFRTVQIYRSISVRIGTQNFSGGILYLEHEFDMPDATVSTPGKEGGCWDRGEGKWQRWVGHDGREIGYDEAPDDQTLVQIPDGQYDPRRDAAGLPPKSGVIAVHDMTTFMVDRGVSEGETMTDIRWSSTHLRSLENFPELESNRFTPDSPNNRVFSFLPVDRVLLGVSPTGYFHVERFRDAIKIDPQLDSFGPVHRRAITKMGSRAIVAYTLGVGTIEVRSMDLAQVTALDQRIQSEWETTQDSIRLCYDSRMGATYILNTSTREASLVGTATNAVTELEDCNFVACTDGPIPDDSSKGIFGYFITGRGLVVFPDAHRQNSIVTNLGVIGTVQGDVDSVAGAGPYTITDSSASFDTDLTDCVVHFFDPDGVEYTGVISSNTGTTFVVAMDSGTPLDTWRYEISPIPFDAQFWQVGMDQDPRSPRDRTRIRTVNAAQLVFDQVGGSGAGATETYARVGVVRGAASSFFSSATVLVTNDSHNEPVEISGHGPMLFPRVRIVRSDLRFDLLEVGIHGSIEGTRLEEI